MLRQRHGRVVALATVVALVFGLTGAVAVGDVDPVLLAAGDIASCTSSGDEATASLLDAQGGDVATLGDNAYPNGATADFANCYEPSWGRHKARTHPATGNHEYQTAGASGHFAYFGAAAGDPSKGYYSYDLGSWHIVVLNSNCTAIGGCGAGSAQELWLRSDLAAHSADCTLAYWHHPRFSSGPHGSNVSFDPFWRALYDAGADLVLAGHDHDYERFAPQTPTGVADPQYGIRAFIVGTGGASHDAPGSPVANSEVRNGTAYGVLKLTLHSAGYDWEFLPIAGQTFTDSGSGGCHNAPSQSVRTFVPAGDARVQEANPSRNYGGSTLRTDGGSDPDVASYLRFSVSGLTGQVTRATLRLYATSGTVDGPTAYPTSSSWTESGLNWTNRPAATGPALADTGTIATSSWIQWDVTPAVTGNGTYSFNLQTVSTDGVDFRSRESGSTAPQLVVEAATGPDTTAPTVSITAPAAGATVAGTTSVSATASDDVAVAGVQFILDGVNLGAEDTSAPYTINWDTTATGSGPHVLSALARDGAGNQTTSTAVDVVVDNSAPPLPPPPTVTLDADPASVLSGGNSTLTWSSTDAATCSASGGWSGSRPPLGNTVISSITASTTFTLTCTNETGQASDDATVSIVPDTEAPSVPGGLASSDVAQTSFTLTWNASIDNVAVAGYKVFRNGLEVATTTTANRNETGLTASTTYAYSVAAFDAAGNVSSQSATLSVATPALPPPSSGLIGAWGFNEGSGTVLTNSASPSWNGTFFSTPTWTTGKYGGALAFDGTDYVEIGNVTPINGVQRLTFMAWVKRANLNAQVLFGKQTTNHGVALEFWNDGKAYFEISNGSLAGGAVNLNDTAWHHVALVLDGSLSGNSNRLRAYVDGNPATITFTGTVPSTTTTNATPFRFGRMGSSYSNGLIDEARLYAKALTQS